MGWTAYPPLSLPTKATARTLWILGLHVLTLSSLAGAINFIVTIVNMRTQGMSWTRMPLFIWAIGTYAVLLLAVLPALSAGLTLLLLDRQAGTNFFAGRGRQRRASTSTSSGSSGHPEVYIMVLPAFGMISEIIPVASQAVFGYKAVAFSTAGIAFLSMLVWAHHMFTVARRS